MDRIVVTGPSSHPPGGAAAGGPRRLADAGDCTAEGAVGEVRMLHLTSHPAPPAWLLPDCPGCGANCLVGAGLSGLWGQLLGWCRAVRAVGPPAWLVPDGSSG